MNPELYHRASELFHEICELPDDAQQKKLAELCGGDEDVRQLVVELLASDRDLESESTERSCPDAAHAPGVFHTFPEISGFRITSCIAEGGMGVVWRAVQEATRREVALKTFSRRALDSARKKARFQREVELTAMLEHPSIARVYDSGIAGDVPYYAMELVEGLELSEYLAKNRLDDRSVLKLLESIARAVQHAHIRGVIHRDLKPSNIIVRESGEPVVVDFGLAKSFSDETHSISLDGQIVGTPAYMSPEQAAGESRTLDTRTDVYSLGVILFRALSGELPHPLSGSTLEVLRAIADTAAQPLRAARPGIEPDLELLVAKALSRDREERYTTAGEFADDISRWLEGKPIEARSRSRIYVLRKAVRRYRVPIAVSLLVLVAAVVVTISYLVSVRESRDRAERWAYGYRVQLASRALRDRNLAETRDLLERSPAHLRNWEWDFLSRQLDLERPFGPPQRAIGADYSSDGSLLAIASGRHSGDVPWAAIFVVRASDGETLLHVPFEASAVSVEFSPDDRELWVGLRYEKLRRLDASTGELLATEPYEFAWDIEMSPDGRWAAVSTYDKGLYLEDLRDGSRRHVSEANEAGNAALSIDAASTRLLWSHDHWRTSVGNAVCIDLESGAEIARWEHRPSFRGTAISRCGKVAVLSSADQLFLWNLETDQKSEVAHDARHAYPQFTPDGERLITASKVSVDVWSFSVAGEGEVSPTGYRLDRRWSVLRGDSIYGIAIHPTRLESYAFGKIPTIVDLATNPQSRLVSRQSVRERVELIPGIEPGPDNRRCALFGSNDVEVCDFRTAESVWTKSRLGTKARAVAWSRDGSIVASGWGTLYTENERPSGAIVLHDANDGSVLRERTMEDRVLALAVDEGRGFLVAFSGPIGGFTPTNPPSTISAHSLSDLSTLWQEEVHGRIIRGPSLRFSPDGRRVALEAEWTLRVWETGSWKKLYSVEGERGGLSVTAFDFHPTDERLVSVIDGELVEIDTRSWKIIRRLTRLDSRPPHLCYSPDGTRLAVSSDAGVTLCDVETGSPLITLPTGNTECARFTPNGEWILTANNDEGGFRAWPRHAPAD